MSSSPRSRHPLRALTLRTRLIAAILALMALISMVIGVATTVALRDFLLDRLDQQLATTNIRSDRLGQPPSVPEGPGESPDILRAPGTAEGTLAAHFRKGSADRAAVLESAGPDHALTEKALTTDQIAAVATVPTDGRPYTRDLGELGDYRLVSRRIFDGDVMVTGLPLSGVDDTVWRLLGIEAVVTTAGLVLAAIAGTAIVRLSLRPLRRVAATAGRVAELPLAHGDVDLSVRVPDADTDPRTEVGQVGAALNRMLGHVAAALEARHASETRVRQFVADASHELRTPLAAIRGYAELTRRGREAIPADMAHALSRVESQSTRMTALVDDLLLLARLDSGRPLASEEVDVSGLVVDAVSDAHAAGPGHRWLLDLPEEALTVPGDSARLHQVLANLLANARTHTPPGTTVVTKLVGAADGGAVITVTDDGPGIPASLQPEVFERFARGDSSRSRAAGSTGLGLSIVAAVVEAHQGHVTVTSRPGQTEFVVRLPGPHRST